MPDWTRRGWALRSRARHGLQLAAWAGAVALAVLALGALYLLLGPERGDANRPLSGAARAVDGDTLRLGDERVRLLGLDAPELDQTCRDAAGAEWDCGAAAHRALAALVGRGSIACAPHGHDQYGRVLARCTAGGTDVGGAVVNAGLAVADGDYGAEERAARTARRGIWAGSFERPRAWRDGRRGFDLWSWIGSWFG